MQNEQLKGGNYYHIYNRGNNRMNLFSVPDDYVHFLELYDKYISQVAETFAWVLMPNHLHLLVRIKENVVYKYSPATPIANKLVDAIGWEKWFEEHKWETTDLSASEGPARLCHSRQTAIVGLASGPDNVENKNIFNADRYADAVGLKGKKQPIPHRHFAHLFNAYTRYYHNRTGGCGNLFERPFKRKRIDNEEWFGNDQNFKSEHKKPVDIEFMDKWLDVGIDYVTGVIDLSAFAEPDNVKSAEPKNVKLAKPDNVKLAEPARLCHSRQTGVVGLAGGPDNVINETKLLY
jgi:hypothetical protein